ncbi:MAG TPA: hypothetical protein VLY24_25195 [Bryobacteraceae bacterium]|nr:hypothetical protein [Bryobacteraceae bacterium]
MLRFVCVLSLLLAAVGTSLAGALPAEPVPPSSLVQGIPSGDHSARPRDRWLRVGLIWGATALDLASTRYALANNPATRESNPFLASNNGSLRTGAYLGVSLPLDALATYANLKYPHSRSLRILTYVTSFAKIGIGVRNFRQGN